jgi:hypothetical protein
MILCYVCKKQVADNAPTCPGCGAVQTQEGREVGRKLKHQGQIVAALLGVLILAPILFCCLGGLTGNGSRTWDAGPPTRGPSGWDWGKVKRDADEVGRDPSKTIFIPADGGQPIVVPDPDP